jgi:hypothetical protein
MLFGTPGGTTQLSSSSSMAPPAPHDNMNILNVAMEDLNDADGTIIEKAAEEFKERCLLSFSKTRDKVI